MTDAELELRLRELVRSERQITNEICGLIREGEKRRLYLARGYSSSFDWLTQGYGYSHSAAHRRIQAARAMRDLPELAEKLESGEVNLTTVAQMQVAVNKEERRTGQKITVEQKQELISKIENKTSDQTQQVLAQAFPESTSPPESLRAINETDSRLSVVLDSEAVEILKELKSLMSHSHPHASWGDIIKIAARESRDRRTKASRASSASNASASEASTQTVAAPAAPSDKVRRIVFRRAQYTCEFIDESTGRRCKSRYQLEVDHVIPRALGGGDDLSNLRCLCRQHNLFMAQEMLGADVMRRYWPVG